MMCRASYGSLALVVLLLPVVARAGNEDEMLVGNQAAMMGGAVAAIVRDSSATWYNPAGLGAVERNQIDISATVYSIRHYSAPALLSIDGGPSNDGSVTKLVVAQSQIAYVRKLSESLTLGFGYFVPRASNYVLREGVDDTRGSETSQWQLAAAGAETQHIGAAAVGIALTPRIRLGFSVIGGWQATTSSVSLFGAVSRDGQPIGSNATTLIATTSSLSLQLGLGMQLDLTDQVALGLTYRSPELQLHSSFDGAANASIASLDPSAPGLGAIAQELQEPPGVDLLRGGRAGASIAYRYPSGVIVAELDFQPALHRPNIEVDRKAVVNVRFGLYHTLSPSVAFGVGLFTDRSPATKDYDFVDGSGDFYGGTLGLELSNEHKLAPGERAQSLIFSSVFALRYAFCAGDFGRIVTHPSEITEMPFVVSRGEIDIHEIGLYVGGGVDF